jgi:NADH:ubiquinone oxidoreductase subunit 5 (subunit L)/multisubunit Na+/H+ antiporter MnhA subunit
LGVHEAPHGFFEMLAHGWLAVLVVALGIGVAWWEFGRKESPRRGFIYKVQPLATLFERRWYVDEAYRWLVDKVVMRVAGLAYDSDNKVVDGASDGLAQGTVNWGRSLSERQLGQVQYSLAIVFVVVVVIVYFVGLY